MPCNHKFQNHLHFQQLDFEPTTLIVGSFSPQWPASNNAGWFYGRTDEICFWDVLPRLYGTPSLINAAPADWKKFCHDNRIALTDLISAIDDADPGNKEHVKILGGFSDKALVYNFDDFVYVNIVQLLRQNATIKHVYITRGVTEAFWRHLWNPVAHYCNSNDLHAKILLPPSVESGYHHSAYNVEHPSNTILRLEDYILMRWKQEWHL